MTSLPISALRPMTDSVAPITVQERLERIERARRLMRENGIDALLLEAGTGLRYFTGVHHWQSERMIAALVPANGEVTYICPAFEEARMRELICFGDDVRGWEEDESPYALAAQALKDRGIAGGTLAVDESTRFFIVDGMRRAAPHLKIVSGDPITIPCRSRKSPAEIALMQRANDINAVAYQTAISMLHEGMTQPEFSANAAAALKALGIQGGIGAQFGAGTAFPHGSRHPEILREGDVVLMDGVCTLEGYHSDISRVVVFGKPTQRHRDVWELEKAAQAAAFAAAQIGAPCEAVDAAARAVITAGGFGPGYKVPGLPHRTGHGIGMDCHEWHNLVKGNTTPLATGMCFTNEPMIAIYGEFGVRLEDCFYMTEDGPRWFTTPSPSIDQPFA